MSSPITPPLKTSGADRSNGHLAYRALSSLAILAMVLGVASLMMIPTALNSLEASLLLAPLPVVGLLVGLRAWRRIVQAPDELTGKPIAIVGVGLSLASLIGGLLLASVVYATEVPDGYRRVTFGQLKPDEAERDRHLSIPTEVESLDGQKVFIKGYMRPPAHRFGIEQFLLVRDNNECCFGKNIPAYYDRIQVELAGNLRTDYSRRMFRAAGTLKIDPSQAHDGSELPAFRLVTDYLE